jgi:hypothetical protein
MWSRTIAWSTRAISVGAPRRGSPLPETEHARLLECCHNQSLRNASARQWRLDDEIVDANLRIIKGFTYKETGYQNYGRGTLPRALIQI